MIKNFIYLLILVLVGCSKPSEKPDVRNELLNECHLSMTGPKKGLCTFDPYNKVCPCSQLEKYEKENLQAPLTTTRDGEQYLNKCYSNRLYGPERIMVFQKMTEEDNVHESMRMFSYKRTILGKQCDALNPKKCITTIGSDGWNSYSFTSSVIQEGRYKQVKCPSFISQRKVCESTYKGCLKATKELLKGKFVKLNPELKSKITANKCLETKKACLKEHLED